MAEIEVRGSTDRGSLIKRFERKSKQQAISELVDFLMLAWGREERLEAEIERLCANKRPAPPAAEQPDTVMVSRELAETIASFDHTGVDDRATLRVIFIQHYAALGKLRALLPGGDKP